MADQLCTTAQVKARIFPAGVTDVVDDTVIGELIDQVSSFIQNYTGRRFIAETAATYVFDTQAGTVLRIPRGIRTVTSMSVSLAHQPDTAGVYTAIPAADIVLYPKAEAVIDTWPFQEVRISRAATGTIRSFANAQNGATITGNFGWTALPPDIVAVAIDAAVAAYASRANGASGVIGADSLAIPPWAGFYGRSSPQRATLERYRYQSV